MAATAVIGCAPAASEGRESASPPPDKPLQSTYKLPHLVTVTIKLLCIPQRTNGCGCCDRLGTCSIQGSGTSQPGSEQFLRLLAGACRRRWICRCDVALDRFDHAHHHMSKQEPQRHIVILMSARPECIALLIGQNGWLGCRGEHHTCYLQALESRRCLSRDILLLLAGAW